MDLAKKLKQHEAHPGILIVLSGPSGVGKDTLLRRLGEVCPGIERCVTYTTREPRPGEAPGVDYNFVSAQEFRRMIEEGEFLEYAQVHLDLYGSPLSCVTQAREKGLDAILKIDVQGGLTVKEKVHDAVMIFVAPPSMGELERRLRARYTDCEAAVTKRLHDARREIEHIPMYDYLVVNDDVEAAVDRLRCIIMAERARIR
ncbi:MAG TPA: guanylate kinase [Armatimonadota bacterium]|nr:guanylate kinase [Armatimonadota bacterium]